MDENVLDSFTYSYYSGTNKLQSVGDESQYSYDNNGNLVSESINNNSEIKYACPYGEHRNLITQITHKEIEFEDSIVYVTYYDYDEAGNRYAKTVFKYTGTSEPDEDIEESDAEVAVTGSSIMKRYIQGIFLGKRLLFLRTIL